MPCVLPEEGCNLSVRNWVTISLLASSAVLADPQELTDPGSLVRVSVEDDGAWTLGDVLGTNPEARFSLESSAAPVVAAVEDGAVDAVDDNGPHQLWIATERGVEHLIEVYDPADSIVERLLVEGLTPILRTDDYVALVDDEGVERSSYSNLHVFDAIAVSQLAWFEVDGDTIEIHVETEFNAQWPIVIDPLASVAVSLPAACNGTISTPACTQANRFGRAMAVGQLLGDARPELVVGTPFFSVINDPAEGGFAIFTPDALGNLVLSSHKPIDNVSLPQAMCGTSIAIGNVVGTVDNDVVVGCPGAFGDPGGIAVFRGPALDIASPIVLQNPDAASETRLADLGGLALVNWDSDLELEIVATTKTRLLMFSSSTSAATIVSTFISTEEPQIAVGEFDGSIAFQDVVVGTKSGIESHTGSLTGVIALPSRTFTLASGSLDGNRVALGRLRGRLSLGDDLVIGRPGFSGFKGRVETRFWSASGWLTVNGFLDGTTANERLGSVVAVGDINLDRHDDVAFCSSGVVSPATDAVCRVWGGSPNMTTMNTISRLTKLNPAATGFGQAIPVIGDFDADGAKDLVIGMPTSGSNVGSVQIFEGSKAVLDGASWKKFFGTTANSRLAAGSLLLADISNDGIDDVILDEPGAANGQGAVHIYLGGPSMDATPDWTLLGVPTIGTAVGAGGVAVGHFLGSAAPPSLVVTTGQNILIYSGQTGSVPASQSLGGYTQVINEAGVDSIAVVNGSTPGFDVLVVGNYDKVNPGRISTYQSYSGSIGLSTSPIQTFTEPFAGCALQSGLGTNVAAVGRIVDDGRDDFVVTMPFCSAAGLNRGRAVLMTSAASYSSFAQSAWVFDGDLNDAQLSTAAAAGDVNGDGFADFALGAQNHGGGSGRVWIFHGTNTTLPSMIASTTLSGTFFNSKGWGLGASIAGGQDFNQDGYGDLAVGLPNFSNNTSTPGQGRVNFYIGSPAGIQASPPHNNVGVGTNDHMGTRVSMGRIDATNADKPYGDVIFNSYDETDATLNVLNQGVARIRVGRW